MLVTAQHPPFTTPYVPPRAPRYTVRRIESADFALLQQLENDIWGAQGETMLCPHYLRLCVEQFGDVCFMAFDGKRPVGYVLNILRGKSAHCGTLAVLADYRRSRVTYLLIAAMIERLLNLGVDECWFTVSPDNDAARQVHVGLGAKVVAERDNYYGPGDTRLLSKIDLRAADQLRARFGRSRRAAAA